MSDEVVLDLVVDGESVSGNVGLHEGGVAAFEVGGQTIGVEIKSIHEAGDGV